MGWKIGLFISNKFMSKSAFYSNPSAWKFQATELNKAHALPINLAGNIIL